MTGIALSHWSPATPERNLLVESENIWVIHLPTRPRGTSQRGVPIEIQAIEPGLHAGMSGGVPFADKFEIPAKLKKLSYRPHVAARRTAARIEHKSTVISRDTSLGDYFAAGLDGVITADCCVTILSRRAPIPT